MRVKVWRSLGAGRGQAEENPLWHDLDEHARALEAMARAIRQDVAKRNASTASAALGNLMRQSQQAYDEVGQLLDKAAAAAPTTKRMVEI
ncbi:MAG: hypothetical protein HY060_19025 [Proteobacteria bacterium]|nr:hypothetical protein [Pseudomonadota bacterium]